MNILADASLPSLTDAFGEHFKLTLYQNTKELLEFIENQDVLLCRSTLKVNAELFKTTKQCLKFIATASSGIDHIDSNYLQQHQIQLLDAKGCNAVSVADYVLSCLAYLNKHLQGNKLGIIGLGKVGSELLSRLQDSKFEVIAYDPYIIKSQQEDLYDCDALCVHAALNHNPPYPSFNLINKAFLAQLKPGCILINASRGGIVNEEDLLTHPKPLLYCTDVYLNEPAIDKRIVDRASLCTPHIAGHSIEAKHNAVVMLSEQLHQIIGKKGACFEKAQLNMPVIYQDNETWRKKILSFYNPVEETKYLKQAQNKNSAFLELRKQHQKRHDFWVYDC